MKYNRKLTEQQRRRIQRIARLRKRLTNSALAWRYKCSEATIANAIREGTIASRIERSIGEQQQQRGT